MATDFGKDIACDASGIGNRFSVVSGRLVVANALSRRLSTPRGGLWYDPDYGFDLRKHLNDSVNDAKKAALVHDVEAECLKDSRVSDARASATYLGGQTKSLAVRVAIDTADGPFALVISVGQLAAQILTQIS